MKAIRKQTKEEKPDKMNKLFKILDKNATIKFENQDFKAAKVNRDWRKYVPECYAKHFEKLRIETKRAIFVLCELQARTEQYREPAKCNATSTISEEMREKLKTRLKTNHKRAE